MKEVLKVSIARVSFTMEKEAHKELDQYLDNLRGYYREESGRDEILDDIEERIAELIIERGGKERVVTLEDINAVITILGKPYENENTFEEGTHSANERVKKSFFRDPEHGVLGGVCSGFAAYSGWDVVWVRILFLLFFLMMSAPLFALRHMFGIHMGGMSFMILVYLILWVIIPPARTIAQKCAMHGISPTVDEIQRKFRDGVKNMGQEARDFGRNGGNSFFEIIGRAIGFCVGIILIIIGISGLIGGWIFLLGINILGGFSPMAILDYLQLNIGNTFWIKISALLGYFLPFIGMLYGGTKLCFRFQSPKWRPGLIIFIIWVISGITFISLTGVAFKPYYRHNDTMQTVPLAKNYDTLYVKYPKVFNNTGVKMRIKADRNDLELFYIKKIDRSTMEIAAYPTLRVYRQSAQEQPRVECEMDYFTAPSFLDERENILTAEDVLTIKDSLITVRPQVYSKQRKFAGDVPYLKLFVPESTVVILQEPMDHNFNDGHYYSNSDFTDWWF
jgi:phage shock protein PspC (stress-responsive transcriptional regulator)